MVTLEDVPKEFEWEDLEKCRIQGVKLHMPNDRIVLFFPCLSFPKVSQRKVFNEAIHAAHA